MVKQKILILCFHYQYIVQYMKFLVHTTLTQREHYQGYRTIIGNHWKSISHK